MGASRFATIAASYEAITFGEGAVVLARISRAGRNCRQLDKQSRLSGVHGRNPGSILRQMPFDRYHLVRHRIGDTCPPIRLGHGGRAGPRWWPAPNRRWSWPEGSG